MSNILEHFLKIRPLKDNDFTRLCISAQADNHSVMLPTHVVEKHGEVIGSLEIATTPLVLVWGHTQKMKVRDSLDVLRFYENYVFGHKNTQFCLPCKTTSPYFEFLKKPELGYLDCGQFNMFIKKA